MNAPRSDELDQHIIDISTPGSQLYGNHLTRDEINRILQSPPKLHDSLAVWLQENDVRFTEHGQWYNLSLTVSQAEIFLNTTFWIFQSGKVQAIRSLRYSVPGNLRPHIQTIQPTTYFGRAKAEASLILPGSKAVAPLPAVFDLATCNISITPACLRDLYQLGNVSDIPQVAGNVLGISGFLEQYARFFDWTRFAYYFAPWSYGNNFTVVSIHGGLDNQSAINQDSTEANLDVQYSMSLAPSSKTIFYTTAGRGPLVPDIDQPFLNETENEPYLAQLTYLLSLPDEELPTVLSTSYGEDEQSVPRDYAIAVCKVFGQLGARGVSVIFSSGDEGVGSSCLSNDGTNTTIFNPGFPASCPFVTSVGGTFGIQPEVANSISGGGFSNIFTRPAYQNQSVGEYLDQLGDRFEGLYNPVGRAFPDVAAQSRNFNVYDKGLGQLVSGTRYVAAVATSSLD